MSAKHSFKMCLRFKRSPRCLVLIVIVLISYVIVYKIVNFVINDIIIDEKYEYIDKMDHSHHMHHDHSQRMDNEHNHGGGGEGDCESMHSMVFHAGVCQYILFPGWVSTNAGEMVGACIVVLLAAALYEGLKCWREILFRKGAEGSPSPSQTNIAKQECGPNANCSGQKLVKYSIMSKMHIIQTLLHMLQVFISYLLMLIFMTYNVWLCLALILGTGLGYLLFGWKKPAIIDFSEHCH